MDSLVPISLLSLELDVPAQRLERQHRDELLLDSVGRLCLEESTALQLVADYRAKLLARNQRATQRAEQAAARHAQVTARANATVRGGVPARPGSSALADLHAADGTP